MTWEEYIVYAVFAVAFVWHLVRRRFKEALFVFVLFLLDLLLVFILAVVLLSIAGDG